MKAGKPGMPDGDGPLDVPSSLMVALIQRAPHIGAEFDPMIRLCADAVQSSPYLRRVAHYTAGVFDFATDVLAELADPAAGQGDSLARRRDSYRRAGQQLAFITSGEDRALDDLRSGRLIRTVLHSDNGAIYCIRVRRGEYVTGLCLERTRASIDAADEALANLVAAIRQQMGLGSENPGGWLAVRPIPVQSRREVTDADDWAARSSIVPFFDGIESSAINDLLSGAVNSKDLHYVAYYQDGQFAVAADYLADHSLVRFFTQVTPDIRRRLYRNIGVRLRHQVTQFSRLMRASVHGRLVRAVLDVEQGAVYYYRLAGDSYLVGVTLDQDEVPAADWRMATLASQFNQLSGADSLEQRLR